LPLNKVNQYMMSGCLSLILLMCTTMVNLQIKQAERIGALEKQVACLAVTIAERTSRPIAAVQIPP